MAYRTEKEQNGRMALIIDGWEKGIADSPYTGITSIKNLNVSWLSGAAYVNYKRLAATVSGGTMAIPKFYTQSPGTSPFYYMVDSGGQVWVSPSGGGTPWTLLTGNQAASDQGYGIAYYKDYLFVFGSNYIEVCGNGTGPGGITSSNWAHVGGTNYYFKNITGRTITPVTAGDSHITLASPWDFASGRYQVIVGNGAQTVTGTFTNGSSNVPITPNILSSNGSTTADINLFTPGGTGALPVNHMALVAIDDRLYFCNGNLIGCISLPDNQPNTATFKITDFTTQQVIVNALTLLTADRSVWLTELNQNLIVAVQKYLYAWDKTSTTKNGVPFQTYSATPINEQPSRMINILNNIYVFAGQKGNIYISNGYSVSLFKKIPDSFLNTIDPYWVVGGMMFHRNKLWFGAVGSNGGGSPAVQGIFSLTINSGASNYENVGSINFESQNSVYTTTLTGTVASGATTATLSAGFVLATGSYTIIFSNGDSRIVTLTHGGTSVSWAVATTSSSTATITVNDALGGSIGITPVGAGANIWILISLDDFYGFGFGAGISLEDVYQSLYYNNGVGGVDYNDNTLWANYEPAIETDLVPIGTFLQSRTFENVEYKLDQPLANGDSIRLSYRTDLSSSYMLVGNSEVTGVAGTTTATSSPATQVISDNFNSNIQNAQWVQFKVEFKCAASNSSFIRLREIRLHYLT